MLPLIRRLLPRGVRAPVGRVLYAPGRVEALDHRVGALLTEVQGLRRELTDTRARADVLPTGAELAVRAAELRDSIHLVARRTSLHRRRTRVLFLVHVLGAWNSYHALVAAMAASDDFEPVVASIPRRFRGSDGLFGEEEVHVGLTALGVAHLRFSAEVLEDVLTLIKTIEPDVVFRQSQWDNDVPDELSTAHLGFARTCLVPYETMNIVVNVGDEHGINTAVDSGYHRTAWLVFCANDMVLETAIRDGARDGQQFRVVGHPKADHLRSAEPHWPIEPRPVERALPGGRPGRVVWSAHHTIGRGWTDFGAFHLMHAGVLAWARERPDVEFVFMPHPALVPYTESASSPISRAEFDTWLDAWAELPNTAVLAEADYAPVLAASDVMLTDGLSMLVEYQILARPVVFFERPGHRPFNAVGERVVRGVHTTRDMADTRRRVERFLGGEADELVEQQRGTVAVLFGDEDSVPRILAELRAQIVVERGHGDRPDV